MSRVLNTRAIATGRLHLPCLGFGGAAIGGLLSRVDPEVAKSTLGAALKAGLSYVDTAPFYGFGRSERVVGDILHKTSYTLSTKVGRLLRPGAMDDPDTLGWPDALPFHPEFDYSYDGILRSFQDSQQRLGLSRIDILYVHDIGRETHGDDNARHFADLCNGGYRALDELRRNGEVKAIGLGVNEAEICRDALKMGDWDVFLLAGRYTLLEQGPLVDLLPECQASGTSVVVGGPYNSGVMVGGDTWNYGAVPQAVRVRIDALKQVCKQHGVALAAAALQFPLAHRVVASVIPGLRSIGELDQTLAWARSDIPQDFWAALKARDLLHPDAPTPESNPYYAH